MITANELMLGNYLKDKNGNYINVGHVQQNWFASVVNDNMPDLFEPIPLTPEILNKCGFEKKEEYGIIDYQLILPNVIAPNGNNEYLLSGKYMESQTKPIVISYTVNSFWASTNIEYLHQLQNLYFALTNEELKVSL